MFSPHWSLRLGPVVHLLHHWHADPRCVLVVEVCLLYYFMVHMLSQLIKMFLN